MQFLFLSLLPVIAFVLLIILIARSSGHSTRITLLEREMQKVRELEKRVTLLTEYVDTLKREIVEGGASPSKKKVEEAARSTDQRAVHLENMPASTRVQTPLTSFKPARETRPSRTREEWEALIGGKLLNRIGALALIIGIGFFLKYAFDNNWINETTRVLIGAGIGVLCLVGGYRTHNRGYQIFAQGMVGAGIAILYLSVYAGFNFYHLMPQWVAFVFMAIVTVVAFLHGLFYDSLAEGILGWAGGFLTPILLSTGHANELGLFTYIVLLDAGLVAMVIKRNQWAILEPLAFVGTWIMYISWYWQYYNDADLWLTVTFVTLFWGIFLVPDVLRSRTEAASDRFKNIIPALNSVASFLALYILIDKDTHAWMGMVTLLMAIAYGAILLVQERRGDLRDLARVRFSLTAVGLIVIATAIQFETFDTVIFWSIEAAVLAWIAKEQNTRILQTAAAVLFGLAIFKLIFLTQNGLMYQPIREFSLLLNHRGLTFAVLTVSLAFGAYTVDRTVSDGNRQTSNLLHGLWCLMLFLLATTETNDFFRLKMLDQPELILARLSFFRLMTYVVVSITLSIPILWFGMKKRLTPLIAAGLLYALVAVVIALFRGAAFDPLEYFTPLFNVRVISLLLAATGLLLHAQFIQRSPQAFRTSGMLVNVLQVGIALVLFVLLTGETRDYFEKDIVGLISPTGFVSMDLNRLQNLQQMSISGMWLLYCGVLMGIGIWKKYRGMRIIAMGLFGITILKIFIYDLSFLETLYRFVSFGALGLILLGVSYAYTKYKDVIAG